MRIRTIKPEFFLHESLFDAESEDGLPLRLAFAGLWCAADREGRFRWQPRRLKAQILPYDEVDFSRVLDALTTRGFIIRYRVGDEWFGVIPTFGRHQFINPREKPSDLPAPPDSQHLDESTTRGSREADASSTRLSLPFPSLPVPFPSEGRGAGEGADGPGPGVEPTPAADPKGPETGELTDLAISASEPVEDRDAPVGSHDPTPPANAARRGRMEAARRLLAALNTLASRSFEPVEANLTPLVARLGEVHDDEDGIRRMIERQVALWKTDERMAPYLRPATLFNRTKFHSYYADRDQPISAPGARNGAGGSRRPHRNDSVGTPESRADWERQVAAADQQRVEGF